MFGHQTWDLEGGQIDPPSVSWFSSSPAGIGLNEGTLEITCIVPLLQFN